MRNTNINEETTMNKTTKTRRTNRKFIASICAVVAATAMITGIAVFTASADPIKGAPETKISSTIPMEKTEKETKKDEAKQEVKTETKDETVNVKHEGEAGYNYVNENGKHPGECGYG